MDNQPSSRTHKLQVFKQRVSILRQVASWLDTPMAVLSVVWLCLMVVEFVWELNAWGERTFVIIWIAFILDFVLRLSLAPRKLRYIRRNWLTALSLFVPAFRIFRIVRVFRALGAIKSLQLVRILGSINRSMKVLGKTMRRRGFGYVLALTVIIIFAGAAGMLHFERHAPGSDLKEYGAALWWTAMIITTMGSSYWPQTPEGRMLCLLLAIYAFSIFGYFTGAVATYFMGKDATDDKADLVGRKDIERLTQEVAAMRRMMEEGE
jgi:voltage-gated potassium channel